MVWLFSSLSISAEATVHEDEAQFLGLYAREARLERRNGESRSLERERAHSRNVSWDFMGFDDVLMRFKGDLLGYMMV